MIDTKLSDQLLDWQEIEDKLPELRTVSGGFSKTTKGIIDLNDGTSAFVKISLDDNTKRWTKKEVETYRYLQDYGYKYIPKLISVNHDDSGFAISTILPDDGWNWNDQWDNNRLDNTLMAMDDLAKIKLDDKGLSLFSEDTLKEANRGWESFIDSPESKIKLIQRLKEVGRSDIADRINFEDEYNLNRQLVMSNDALVHYDIRADNCAWNQEKSEVRLVDWNWVQLGDRRIDMAGLLTHVQKTGFDVLPDYSGRLDALALHWLAGFWFKSSIEPDSNVRLKELRQLQLLSGITAIELRDRLRLN